MRPGEPLKSVRVGGQSPGGGPLNRGFLGVNDGTRTRDILDHNQVLYQLSYAHHDCHFSAMSAPPGKRHERPSDEECTCFYEPF